MLSRSGLNAEGYPTSISTPLGQLASTISKLLDDANDAVERDNDIVRSCLARALALLRDDSIPYDHSSVRSTQVLQSTCSGLVPWQIRLVTAYIQNHFDKPIRAADLAAISRLSVSYFSVAFKRSFGVPPRTFLARVRVERAQRLMLSTSRPLSWIALDCGFCDQAHLSKQFRHTVGRTPQSWRREHVGEPAL